MKHIFIATALAFLTAPQPAQAEVTPDEIRSALDAADYDLLEQTLAAAHAQALADKDFTPLRSVYGTLFEVANKQRLAEAEAWLAARPSSPYAASALAWLHIQRAFLSRGTFPTRWTSREALEAYNQELVQARAMTDLALNEAPDFMPALDASIRLKTTHIDDRALSPVLEQSLTIAPNEQSLLMGLSALQLNWGGSVRANMRLCKRYAALVPGYDEDICIAKFVFYNDLEGDWRARAIEIVKQHEDGPFDGQRLELYLNEWHSHENAQAEAVRLLHKTLRPKTSPEGYMHSAHRIGFVFKDSRFEWDEKRALMGELKKRLIDSPQDRALIDAIIGIALDLEALHKGKADMAELYQYWLASLDLGAHLSKTWELGANIEGMMSDAWDAKATARNEMFRANDIYYSNHEPHSLSRHLISLFFTYQIATGELESTQTDPAVLLAMKDASLCPMIRLERVYTFICQEMPDEPGCNIGGIGEDFPVRIREIAQTTEDCAEVKGADFPALIYTPVPVEAFLNQN